MRKLTQKLILHLLDVFPSLETYKFVRFIQNQKLPYILRHIQNIGLKINVVYDVGANHGHWSTMMKRTVLPRSDFILFEANPSHKDELESLGFRYFISTLSAAEGHVEFYSNAGTGDSYYRENSVYYEKTVPNRLPTTTIDKIVQTNKLPLPDFVKLDTQGSEVDILLGGKSILLANLVLLECPIINYNLGAPKISKYIDIMNENQFVPIEITEMHYRQNVFVQADILFLKKDKYISLFGNSDILF